MRREISQKINDGIKTQKALLGKMNINDDEIQEIMEYIKKVQPNVSTIDLDNNQLCDKGAGILGQMLQDIQTLKQLSLQFNQIGSKGALAIFGLKNERRNLEILFHGNKIRNVSEIAEIEQEARQTGMKP